MSSKRPYCLTVAGFDPSGGAGVVADCKTFERIGVHGLSVLTSNTVQTEDQFHTSHWITEEIIEEQLALLLQRYPVRFVKIGLIKDGNTLLQVLQTIRNQAPDAFILWDPVIRPSAGGDLTHTRFNEQLTTILPLINGILPNVPEYAYLFGEKSAELVATEVPFLYMKGGHSENRGKDVLYYQDTTYPFKPHIHTTLDKHGTGCVFSAALLAHLALDYPVVKACLRSKRYLERFLVSNSTLLGYH